MKNSDPYCILVGIDFSDSSREALDVALDEVFRHETPELHVVTVLDRNGQMPEPSGHARNTSPAVDSDDAIVLLNELLMARLRERPARPLRAFSHVRIGAPDRMLLELAEEIDPDLIVVGTHGRTGLGRMWIGSVAERTVRNAHCPVLVVRPKLRPEAPPPTCTDCEALRVRSMDARWWCDRHRSTRRDTAHTYHYLNQFEHVRDAAHKLL